MGHAESLAPDLEKHSETDAVVRVGGSKAPATRWRVTLDIGASDPLRASLKTRLESIGEPATSVQLPRGFVSPGGTVDEQAFLEGIALAVESAVQQLRKTNPGATVEEIGIFVPGPVVENRAQDFQTLKAAGGTRTLGAIDFGTLAERLAREDGSMPKIRAAHDSTGMALALLRALAQHPHHRAALLEGAWFSVLYPGGGVGSAGVGGLEGQPPEIKLGRPMTDLDRNSGPRYANASVPGFLRQFGAAFGLEPAAVDHLVQLGRAEIVTQGELRAPSTSADAEQWRSSGLFEETRTAATSVFRLHGSSSKRREAALFAIERFIEGGAELSAVRAREGVRTIVVTGPLSEGVAAFLRREAPSSGSLEARLLRATKSALRRDDAIDALPPSFRITREIKLEDNTPGGGLLFQTRFDTEHPTVPFAALPPIR